ncbi:MULTISPECIES: PIN domain-containing protein [Streptomyces]|uniref:Nucleic acid-binding protein n=1 Tax=Streptomyces demainii TaxID=588122 RepID=A0ABT9KU00_9ACTN|nr:MULTISPECIES: PIN domain-containing protein [Streptomyces]MCO8304068.1 ThiF family adenylyltransferase [Streptomyces sp. RKCA744]MDP9611002.1 putative nucleic acid-binding protein [Streptomyces demainii]
MTKRVQQPKRLRVFVLDSEALSQAVRGERRMITLLDLAAKGEAEVITSPMTVIEAHDGRITERRWDWVLSRVRVADLGRDQARAARRLLADAGLHGHKYAIDAVLAVVAREQKGQVTVFTSDVDDLERLLPPTVVISKV